MDLNKQLLEEKLSQLPLFHYAFMPVSDLQFSDRVRHICKTECPMYGTTWACPPAVGTVEACKETCLQYDEFLMIATVNEVSDIEDLSQTLATRKEHEAITAQVAQLMKEQGCRIRVLSTEACSICETCTYPDAPCRFPEKMFPCVESHGILVTDLAEKCGIEFFNGNIVTWFSVILFR